MGGTRRNATLGGKGGRALAVYVAPNIEAAKPTEAALPTEGTEELVLILQQGQSQTLRLHSPRRYRIGRVKAAGLDSDLPAAGDTAPPWLVLRQSNDLWLHTAHDTHLLLAGFYDEPGNQLQLDLSPQRWWLDPNTSGQALPGTDAQLLFWRGAPDQWPQDC